MLFPSPSTWKIVKDAPNHVPMNMIGLDHTSRKIPKDGDVPIFPVVLITPDPLHLTVIVPVSHYTPSVWRLIQYIYDRTFSARVLHTIPRGTRKPDNPLKGIRNPITWNPDNPLNGIKDLLQMEPGTSG